MLEIILARHGETDWNTEKIFRGRADVALNDNGIRQAELLGKYLGRDKFDTVFSSPLQRAVKTAVAVASPHSLQVKIVEALNDADCGRWQGLTSKEVEREYPELYMDWHEKPGEFRFPGGETLEQVRSRAMRFVQDKVMRCREGSVALVSHRLVLKVLICALLGLDNSFIWNFQLDTGGISRFSYDGRRVVLIVHNDTTYLKSVGSYRPVDF